ncbi:heme-dependent oxidative N-demethylase subunit alpha family protein [Glycocaulis abyssi]|uniref:Heme-dependent oxidative N-demethylase subunit alpha family protein n=1 Tax=Glycocaulis abyssi TaxID=1433403 RepID=A0ABV9NBF1_9PROT
MSSPRPPHTPWRDGPPRFAVGLKPIAPDTWLVPDTEADSLPERRALLADFALTSFEASGAGPAAREAALLATGHLHDAGMDAPEPEEGPPALWQLAHHVSDDLVVMMPGRAGWYVGAAVLTSPTFFSLPHAAGKTLHALHQPVPGGDQLATRIARVFDHVRPGQVLERFNWTLQAGDDRFTPDGAPLRARALAAKPGEAEALLHVRVERQTITKLEDSGAVLFTIRICLDPVAALDAKEKAALGAAWHGADDAARGYKKWAVLDHLVAAALPAP